MWLRCKTKHILTSGMSNFIIFGVCVKNDNTLEYVVVLCKFLLSKHLSAPTKIAVQTLNKIRHLIISLFHRVWLNALIQWKYICHNYEGYLDLSDTINWSCQILDSVWKCFLKWTKPSTLMYVITRKWMVLCEIPSLLQSCI